MNSSQELTDISSCLHSSSSILRNGCYQSTLWIGNTGNIAIATITIHELPSKLVILVKIPDIYLVRLSLKVTSETVLIQGELTESTIAAGYFRPSKFESLIPLPHPVKPETCCADIQLKLDSLTIRLTKNLECTSIPKYIYNPTVEL